MDNIFDFIDDFNSFDHARAIKDDKITLWIWISKQIAK